MCVPRHPYESFVSLLSDLIHAVCMLYDVRIAHANTCSAWQKKYWERKMGKILIWLETQCFFFFILFLFCLVSSLFALFHFISVMYNNTISIKCLSISFSEFVSLFYSLILCLRLTESKESTAGAITIIILCWISEGSWIF